MAGMLTVKETAEQLGVKPATVRAWIHRREKLEVVKVGRAVRIPSESLAVFISDNTRTPVSLAEKRRNASRNRSNDLARASVAAVAPASPVAK